MLQLLQRRSARQATALLLWAWATLLCMAQAQAQAWARTCGLGSSRIWAASAAPMRRLPKLPLDLHRATVTMTHAQAGGPAAALPLLGTVQFVMRVERHHSAVAALQLPHSRSSSVAAAATASASATMTMRATLGLKLQRRALLTRLPSVMEKMASKLAAMVAGTASLLVG